MKYFFVFLVSLSLFHSGVECFDEVWQNYIVLHPKPLLEFWWNIVEDEIHVQLRLHALSFIGLGFHNGTSESGMVNADIIASEWLPGGVFVSDHYAEAVGPPPNDTTNGCPDNVLPGYSGTQETVNGTATSTVTWARKLNTGDSQCDQIISNRPTNVIWAFAQFTSKAPNRLGFHNKNSGVIVLNLLNPSSTSSSSSNLTTSSSASSTGNPSTSTTNSSGSESSGTAGINEATKIVIAVAFLVISLAVGNLVVAFFFRHRKASNTSIEGRKLLSEEPDAGTFG